MPAKLLREAEVEDGSSQPTALDHRHRRRTSASMRRNRLRRNSRQPEERRYRVCTLCVVGERGFILTH